MNVNFCNKKLSLFVNGVLCARRSVTLLMRGTPENEFKKYEPPIGVDVLSVFSRFDIRYDYTWIRHRLHFTTDWCFCLTKGAHAVFRNGTLYADDIRDVTLKIEYEPCVESVSMENLLRYPADLVIDYLKERGITSCPLATG